MPAITVENVTKQYRVVRRREGIRGALRSLVWPEYDERRALSTISFTVEAGEAVGYIGVNGSGKSTTVKVLTGILVPTSGRVAVLGRNPHRERVANAADIGVVFGQRTQLWWDLPLVESFQVIARMYGVSGWRSSSLFNDLADTLELAPFMATPVRNLSLGQRMRAELAAAVLHGPKILYLDEPTVGLDIFVKAAVRKFVRALNRDHGVLVFLSSHDLRDIEQICDRIIILHAGSILFDGALARLKTEFARTRTLMIDTAESEAFPRLPDGVELLSRDSGRLVARFDQTRITPDQIIHVLARTLEIREFALFEPDLESIVRELYAQRARQECLS